MSKKNKYKRKTTAKKSGIAIESADKSAFDEDAYSSYMTGSKRIEPPRVITDKQARRGKIIRMLLRIALIICTCIWAVFFNVVAGIGMVIQSQSELHKYGVPLLIATGIVIIATVLVLKNKNILAVAVGIVGMIAVLVIVSNMCEVVDALALSDDEFRMLSDIYKNRHNPTMVVTLFQVILAVVQFFGYEESVKRAEKRRKKLEEKYAEAPKILDDND